MPMCGVCEVQVPLALQLAVEAVLGAQGIWSTEVTLGRAEGRVNRIRNVLVESRGTRQETALREGLGRKGSRSSRLLC